MFATRWSRSSVFSLGMASNEKSTFARSVCVAVKSNFDTQVMEGSSPSIPMYKEGVDATPCEVSLSFS